MDGSNGDTTVDQYHLYLVTHLTHWVLSKGLQIKKMINSQSHHNFLTTPTHNGVGPVCGPHTIVSAVVRELCKGVVRDRIYWTLIFGEWFLYSLCTTWTLTQDILEWGPLFLPLGCECPCCAWWVFLPFPLIFYTSNQKILIKNGNNHYYTQHMH
jgi:hypothetical protein